MTGDRLLQEHEMKVFMQHGSIGLNTVRELLFTGGEPTLFEVALIEIIAKVDAHTGVLIEQGARIVAIVARDEMLKIRDRLEMSLKLFNTRLNELDETCEKIKSQTETQISELRKVEEMKDD